jgi:hypothetical protein
MWHFACDERTRMRQRYRWGAVAVLLGLGALLSPGATPLYDGVGFPDEPYRFVPAREGTPAATTATVSLRVTDGVNSGGLLANSAELGPQVSVYAPPRAFQVAAGSTAPITLTAKPVVLTPPAPPGEVESNVYAIVLSSPAGEVTIRSDAQRPGITLRAVSVREPLPVMFYRASAGEWRELVTRRVGRDNFNAVAPGAGEYVLARSGAVARKDSGGSSAGLLLVVGAVLLLMVAVVVGVRLAGRGSKEPAEGQPEA